MAECPRLSHQVQAADGAEMVVHECHVDAPLPDPLQSLLAGRDPLEVELRARGLGEQGAREEAVIAVVLHEQDSAPAVMHAAGPPERAAALPVRTSTYRAS